MSRKPKSTQKTYTQSFNSNFIHSCQNLESTKIPFSRLKSIITAQSFGSFAVAVSLAFLCLHFHDSNLLPCPLKKGSSLWEDLTSTLMGKLWQIISAASDLFLRRPLSKTGRHSYPRVLVSSPSTVPSVPQML